MSSSEAAKGKVRLQGANGATEVFLIDSAFRLVEGRLARLEREVPVGVYKARFQLGTEIHDVLGEVREDEPFAALGPQLALRSAAPLRGAVPNGPGDDGPRDAGAGPTAQRRQAQLA